MEINEKINEIIQQAKEEGAYMEDFDAFEQAIYDQGFQNAISFMLWNPSERSCSNCQYQNSRELCGGRVLWGKILETKIGGVSMKFKLITSSGFDEYTKDLLGELLGAFNKPAKFADKIKSKEVKRTWFHTIEIDSLEELLEFKQACGCNIVIEEVGNIPTLEIYDSYRE